ncbi:C40 family peptidase [Exiguobacterium antarcticum]|uniref:C40 family peptidase n=1 Tax=Exiguobacterium antarcticum TaxID=132920 RepID=UPI0006861F76|nr:NlpC/P60 family protein [Exiguobacterium antarcticum]
MEQPSYRSQKRLKGRPYVTGPVSFDVYNALGKSLPRTAAAQYGATKRTAPVAGDLVFFTHGSGIQHVGIAVDGSTMINANSYYGQVVKESFRSGYGVHVTQVLYKTANHSKNPLLTHLRDKKRVFTTQQSSGYRFEDGRANCR